jgi:hypothetical protein
VPHRGVHARHPSLSNSQRKRPGCRQIARAVLVVYRERLGGVFREQRRTAGRVQNLPPADGGAGVLPRAA